VIKVLEVPCDVDWERLPGFVSEQTRFVFRVMVKGVPVTCETPAMLAGVIQELQERFQCEAKRIQSAVERRREKSDAD